MWLLRPGLPRLQEEWGRKVTLRAGQTGDRGAVTAPLEGHYGEQGEDCSVTPTIRAAWQHSWWTARWHAGQAGRAVRGWGGPALQIQRCLLDPAASHQDPEEPEKNSGKTWAAGTLGCLGLSLPPALCLSWPPPHLSPGPLLEQNCLGHRAPKPQHLIGQPIPRWGSLLSFLGRAMPCTPAHTLPTHLLLFRTACPWQQNPA